MGNFAYDVGFKDGAISGYNLAKNDITELLIAAQKTLDDNLHLCDGDICTLKELRDAVERLPHQLKKIITSASTGPETAPASDA